ncbi:S-fimbrial adhesin protein SfaH [Escherichia coli TA206]|uniref:fimbrial protein n=1 Tax=Escherichia coli TaxID=562 RepID=UPI0001E8AA61|nr:fimbrial protein [Escherichia coli]EGI25814.1 S-fimbrial adhesin protein SfaH [Escherichia coli TA206]
MLKYYSLLKKNTVLTGCVSFTLMMAFSNQSFAMICQNIQSGVTFSSGTQSFRVILKPKVSPGDAITVFDLSDFVRCMNEDPSGNNYDYVKLRAGSGFPHNFGAKTNGRLEYNNYTYPSPLTQDTYYYSVYQYGMWQHLPLKLSLYPELGAFGKLINAGELIAVLNIQKESTYGQDAGISHFTWKFFADKDVYLQTGTCSVSSHNVQVNLSDYPASPMPIPLTIRCNEPRQVSYTLSGKIDKNKNTIFSNMLTSGAQGVGIQLLDSSGMAVPAGQKQSLGWVRPSTPTNIGLRAAYALTNGQNPPTPGRVQSLVDVTFEYN